MAKKAMKKKVIPIPQNQEELIEYLKDLNQAARAKEALEIKIKEKKEAIERAYAADSKILDEAIAAKAEGIYLYCQANRSALTQNNKIKTVAIPGGTILWRKNPPSVEISRSEADAVQELLLKDMPQYVRIKREVNKEAILEKKDAPEIMKLKCLEVKEGDEVFAIKPADVKIELEKGKRKFKIKKL